MKIPLISFSLLVLIPALFLVPNANADGIIGTNLSTFAILGGAGVAINGTGSVITGSVGGCCVALPQVITLPYQRISRYLAERYNRVVESRPRLKVN